MAQQTLDFVIAQQVTGQADVARLIKSVGALDAEMQKLRAASASMSGGFNQAANAIRGNTNVLDAQSKALRNSRQGLQMAGMQVNDFATSVSTGASPVQAFNQQIGQLGYAMSLMGGTAGRVGTFLAGPWGAAIVVATMVLGQLAESFFKSGEAAEDASAKISQIKLASDATSSAQGILGKVMDVTTGKMRNQSDAAINLARAQLEVERIQSRIRGRQAETALREAAARRVTVGQMVGGNITRAGAQMVDIKAPTVSAAAAARALRGDVSGALDNLRALNDQGKITDQRFAEIAAAAANLGVEKENIKIFEDALKKLNGAGGATAASISAVAKSTQGASAAAREAISPMQQFLDSFEKADSRLALARQAFADGAITMRQYREEFLRAGAAQRNFPKVSEDMIAVLQGADKGVSLPVMLKEIETPPALQEILNKNVEIKNSFDAIGFSVANAFKGMLTGAQSFGDAMKGIIQSVIEELFRLFVVQQIVGMVSGALTGAFGGASPSGSNSGVGAALGLSARGGSAGATGGYPAPGKPVMVGERGPEMFVPTSSGKIIPNHQMGSGGGGMTINVDARGATSPEMVRQQVQQGILEAAPSIVAAAEQRTISTLRRPRLGGVM